MQPNEKDSAQPARKAHTSGAPPTWAEVLRTAQAARYCGMGDTSFWAMRRADPTFPKPLLLTERARGFRRADLDAWLESKRAKVAA